MFRQLRAVNRVLRNGQQLYRAAAFADRCVLAAEGGVDKTEDAQCRCVIGLFAHRAFEFRASREESSLSRGSIASGASGQTLAPGARKIEVRGCSARRDRRQSLGDGS